MARREYSKTQDEPIDPTPAVPFVDAQVVNATLVDTITNTVMASGTNYVNQGGYIYQSSIGTVEFNIPIEGGKRYVFPNTKYKWVTAPPNPPTNGVSPEYFGEGLRLVTTLYCEQLVSDSRANGSAIIGCVSHNNVEYIGFNVSMKTDTSTFYINRYSYFEYPAETIGPITLTQNATNPMKIQVDMTETEYRIKLFEQGSTIPVGDSGVQSGTFTASVGRYSPLMTSNWGQAVSRPRVYVQSYQYYKESTLSDFMS